jgi:Rrf2 family nitric oxide-sensitive transcriptional repressor
MRLTMHTDLALRTLMYLGLASDRLASIPEIAAAYRISENHLTKVVLGLARAGFIETLRGRGGGLRLAMPPEEIRIGAVVRGMQEDLALVACFSASGQPGGDPLASGCAIAGLCRLQSTLGEALGAFLAVLDGKTLADLLPRSASGAMRARLGLPADPATAASPPQ